MGQHLSEDVGHPLMDKLVSSIHTLFTISDNKDEFVGTTIIGASASRTLSLSCPNLDD